jgi:hypothetical protein
VGPATWHLENGEVTGTPGPSGTGGWLVLNRSYQDVGLYAKFKCSGGCQTGILFRIEKTGDGGMKGSYAELSGGDTVAYYAITVDPDGKIVDRKPLPRGGGQMRIAPLPNPNQAARSNRPPSGGFNPYEPVPGVNYPFVPPDTNLSPDRWNDVELMFDANILRATQNNGRQSGGVADANGYGPIGFYVGGSGEVQYEEIAYKDLMLRDRAPDYTSPDFRKQTLNNFYYSWGAAAADFNHDGITDVVSGPYIYYGPDYRKSREIFLAQTSNPSTEYAENAWMEFAGDFEVNGWPDAMTCRFGAPAQGCYLYSNSKGEDRRWDVHRVIDQFSSEIAVLTKLNGRPTVTCATRSRIPRIRPVRGRFTTSQNAATGRLMQSALATSTAMAGSTFSMPTDGGSIRLQAKVRGRGSTTP